MKKNIVIVGGGGHVGLPLGLVLASCGHKVTALDTSKDRVQEINSGKMPFFEEGAQELLDLCLGNHTFTATENYSALKGAEVVIIVIGTPVDEHLNPDPNAVIDTIKTCIPYLDSSQLIILRSTIFPGVTNKVKQILKGYDLNPDLTFCPERILEGKALKELRTLPQIIGTDSPNAAERVKNIFDDLGVSSQVVSYEEAELAKLFTNVWRYIKFAAANQFWMMSNDAGLDYTKILKAITFEYPRAADLPNAGFTAGPCLFKDTMQLAAFSDNNFGLGHAAMLVNEGMPQYILKRLEERFDVKNLTVGILGMAFKGDSDDTRSSLAYKLKKYLKFKAFQVVTSDRYVTTDSELLEESEVLKLADVIIIGAPHSAYKEIKFNKPVLDVWNLLGEGNLI